MNRRHVTIPAPWIAALVIFTVWITWRAKALEFRLNGQNPSAILTGKQAPAFTLPALDGRAISLAEYRGRNVVLSFWASWCGPCRMEAPVLAAFYARTHKTADYEVLAISLDESREAAQSAATDWKVPFPVLLDQAGIVAKEYLVEGIPTLIVIDRNGKVQHSSVGFDMTMEFVLAQQLGIRNYTPATQMPAAQAPAPGVK